MSISSDILSMADSRPDDTVFVYPDRRISGRELAEAVRSCVLAMKHRGLFGGEWVAVCSTVIAEAVYASLACHQIGAPLMMVNLSFDKDRIRSLLRRTSVRLLFVNEDLYDFVRPALEGSGVETVVVLSKFDSMSQSAKLFAGLGVISHRKLSDAQGFELIRWHDFLRKGAEAEGGGSISVNPSVIDPDAPALMVWSSGTTGESKGIILSEEALRREIQASRPVFNYTTEPGDPLDATQNLWSATTYIQMILVMLSLPRPVIVSTGVPLRKRIRRYGTAVYFCSPTGWMKIISSGAYDDTDFSGLKLPACGGERITPAEERMVNDFLSARGCKSRLSVFWGLSEFASMLTESTGENKVGSVGRALPGIRIETFDPERPKEPLARGCTGELFVVSPSVMLGYFEDEEATKQFFFTDEEGVTWGRTGDAGFVDEDGYVFVLGRRDSIFYPDGVHGVYPAEIENVIAENLNVLACAVVYSDINGQITAHLHPAVKDRAAQEQLIQEIRAHCAGRLPAELRPAGYRIWPEGFPLNESGKRNISAMTGD